MLPHIFGTFKARIRQSYVILPFWNKNGGNRFEIDSFTECCVGTENRLKSQHEQFKSVNFSKILFLPVFCLIIVQNNEKLTILMIFDHFSSKKTKNLRFLWKSANFGGFIRNFKEFNMPLNTLILDRLPLFLFQNSSL